NAQQKMNALILRQWNDTDLELFTEMDSDPQVMRYLLPMTRNESLVIFSYIRKKLSNVDGGAGRSHPYPPTKKAT
ncbi:GNAT family N-acetyltransferase, partial [Rubritalea sp.]|uniref:GNAT family N-acetyltransferase n=1 Tax=Rubritalea sp. TaxID=2109375 RepID=UPI003EF374B0